MIIVDEKATIFILSFIILYTLILTVVTLREVSVGDGGEILIVYSSAIIIVTLFFLFNILLS